jgi:23S rRNA pseudouridine2605 synthase
LPNAESDAVSESEAPQRLQKVLAAAGVGSRRVCEELIAAGRVTVDGRRATLGDKVDPSTAVVHVDGERVVLDPHLVYLALNKPRGVVSTMDDDRGRTGLADLLGDAVPERVYHVGRLDADSEGLLLLTNDGDLANKLTHPSYGVAKTYRAQVSGPVPAAVRRRLLAGRRTRRRPARADAFRVVDATAATALVEITLHRGAQAHRAADARPCWASRVPAHPYPGGSGHPGQPQVGPRGAISPAPR